MGPVGGIGAWEGLKRKQRSQVSGKDAKTVKHERLTRRLHRAASRVRAGQIRRNSDPGRVDARGDVCDSITRRKITGADCEEAISMFRSGSRTKDIAAELRVTKASVRKILYDAGVSAPPRRMTDTEIREATRRYEEGESLARLSERFGYSTGTIRTKLIRAGVEMRPTSIPRAQRVSSSKYS